ncbi:MAG TPA: ribosome small subunit-dependent GTPase A [Oligoflexia bacterium]|nr:ribosome small subunit-dependent GTPase A [Oligoflexia bacterium]HMP47556.1 ribosome small subunit-dependent GTPase A [Oligoflexia bacterium]
MNKPADKSQKGPPADYSTEAQIGLILSSSRRFVELLDNSGRIILGTLGSRKLEAVPGDVASFTLRVTSETETQAEVISVENRKNLLQRSFEKKIKLLAANLDALCIVTAPPPLFNTIAIDRVIASALNEEIPVYLIANKYDLPNFDLLSNSLDYYEKIGIKIFKTSALDFIASESSVRHQELKKCRDKIRCALGKKPQGRYAFAGVSGVGKSTLLKALFPDYLTEQSLIKTGEVSYKTGQGKQTTSAGRGYPINKPKLSEFPSIIIDLPGIQSFGISHLKIAGLHKGMNDILELSYHCKFSDCIHEQEPGCNVLKALESGILPQSRYDSFRDMAKEINKAKDSW